MTITDMRRNGVRSAKVVTVIQTVVNIGKGTEDDPCRYLYQYWDPAGHLLAEHDNIEPIKSDDADAPFPLRRFESVGL